MTNWQARTPLTFLGIGLASAGCLGAGFALLSPLQGALLVLACLGGAALFAVGVVVTAREIRRS